MMLASGSAAAVIAWYLKWPSLVSGLAVAIAFGFSTGIGIFFGYYPAHKAESEPRFAEINRGITDNEFCDALELARDAGLWRFDTRWRHVIPHGAPVWFPRMRQRPEERFSAN